MVKIVKIAAPDIYDLEFKCPACGYRHGVRLKGYHDRTKKDHPEFFKDHQDYYKRCEYSEWSFNGDFNNPTLSPSINYNKNGKGKSQYDHHCHFFVKNGNIQYCGDCTHGMAGKTVELPEIE